MSGLESGADDRLLLLMRGGVIGLGADRELGLQLEKTLLADAANVHQLLELFVEDGWRNVYAGELEVRPPGAPTIG